MTWDNPEIYARAKISAMNGHKQGVIDQINKMTPNDAAQFAEILTLAKELRVSKDITDADDLQPIETAPTDGTMFWGTHNRRLDGEFWPLRKMFWGRGKPHNVDGDTGMAQMAYVVNGGAPCWLNEDGIKMAPRPTHWKPIKDEGE
jgi:hypothetical protein